MIPVPVGAERNIKSAAEDRGWQQKKTELCGMMGCYVTGDWSCYRSALLQRLRLFPVRWFDFPSGVPAWKIKCCFVRSRILILEKMCIGISNNATQIHQSIKTLNIIYSKLINKKLRYIFSCSKISVRQGGVRFYACGKGCLVIK